MDCALPTTACCRRANCQFAPRQREPASSRLGLSAAQLVRRDAFGTTVRDASVLARPVGETRSCRDRASSHAETGHERLRFPPHSFALLRAGLKLARTIRDPSTPSAGQASRAWRRSKRIIWRRLFNTGLAVNSDICSQGSDCKQQNAYPRSGGGGGRDSVPAKTADAIAKRLT